MKFVAKIFVEVEQGYYQETLTKVLPMPKEDSEFHLKLHSYIADFSKTAYIDSQKRPVLFFMRDIAEPVGLTTEGQSLFKIKPVAVSMTKSLQKPSTLFNLLFRRNMMKQIMQLATRAKEPTPFWVYMLLGCMIGFVAGIIAYPYVLHATTTGVTTVTGH